MQNTPSKNSLNTLEALVVGTQVYTYFSIKAAEHVLGDLSYLPCSIKILLENLLRNENGINATVEDMRTLTAFHAMHKNTPTIPFFPARILLNDETGVSVMSDLASLQSAANAKSKKPLRIDFDCPADIVIDHTITPFEQNIDRFALLKWAEKSFQDLRIIPPGNGVSSQVNVDVLSQIVQFRHEPGNEVPIIIPDTVLGTDRRISVVNSLGVLAWNIDALDAESYLLGFPDPINLPGVIGLKLTGKLRRGTTATDIALAVTRVLSQQNCKDKIVEFFGPGLDQLNITDRSVISSFAIESGAMSTYFPIDSHTIEHLTTTGNSPDHIALVEAYAKAQGLWRETGQHDTKAEPAFSSKIEISLDTIRPALSGPQTVTTVTQLSEIPAVFTSRFSSASTIADPLATIKHGDILLATIASCGNTAHPLEMAIAGLIARKAVAFGLTVKPWVRAVLADANPVISAFLHKAGLLQDIEALGFVFGGKDCSTCLACPSVQEKISQAIVKNSLTVCSVSSGVRQANEPLHPLAQASYLGSPALVVAYAISGTIMTDLSSKPLATSKDGRPVIFKDLWPTTAEINAIFELIPFSDLYHDYKDNLLTGNEMWTSLPIDDSPSFTWKERSTFVRCPPYLAQAEKTANKLSNIKNARVILIAGDNTPSHFLGATGMFSPSSPAGYYLAAHNEPMTQPQPYSARTGNSEIMIRGAFSAEGLKNLLLPKDQNSSGLSIYAPTGQTMSIFDVAEKYNTESTAMVVAAGKNFGSGQGHEWAAKSMSLLGIRFVLAESYDPVFKINLVRMGILPLQLKSGVSIADLKLNGYETINFAGISEINRPHCEVMMTIEHSDEIERYMLVCKLDTAEEVGIYTSSSLLAAKLSTII